MAKIVTLLARKGTALFRTVLLVSVIAITAAAVVYAEAAQDKAVEKAIKQYVSVATSQYEQGLYPTAKESLESVKTEYQDIFTKEQASEIEELLGKVNEALGYRSSAASQLDEGIKAYESGSYAKAIESFEQVKGNEYASDAQKEEAQTRKDAAQAKLAEAKDAMEALFAKSYELYKEGDFAAAKAGFEQVKASGVKVSRWFGQDSDYFLSKIEDAQNSAKVEVATEPAKQEVEKTAAKTEEAVQMAPKQVQPDMRAEMKAVFDKSYELYNEGKLMEAKEGFAKVAASGVDIAYFFGRDADYYMNKIDKKIEADKIAQIEAAEKAAAEEKAMAEAAAKAEAQRIAAEQEKARKAAEAKALADAKAAKEAEAAAKAEAARVAAEQEKARKAAEAKALADAKAAKEAEAAEAKALASAQKADVQKVEAAADTQITDADESVAKTEQELKEDSYIRVIQQKRDRQRDYTQAIVSDSVMKANEAIEAGDYSAAKGALAVAYANVEKTKMLLGDALYNQYKSQLDELSAQIDAAQAKAAAQEAKVKRIETEQLQEKIRSNVEAQRQRAVKDYLANAMAFQREQRYKEALAQLEALLAIDPLNSIALLQKQTIEETITWREQLSIEKEKHEQEIETLLNSDRASIPYSDEVTYPKTWKDIVERRKSQQDNNFEPEDLSVYRALEQTVDLTSFYEDMTFGEAIDILANSMEPPVTIVVLWTDLDENAFVDRNTAINLTIPAPVKAKLGLSLLLSSVAGGLADISYVVTDGVIRIATAESLPDKLVVRKYDVTELLSPSAEFNFDMDTTDYGNQGGGRSAGGGGGNSSSSSRSSSNDDDQDYDSDTMRQEAQGRASAIIQLIQETIDPESWYDAGGEASLTTYSNNVLVIRQTLENHEKIRELIDDLRSSLGEQVAIEARFLTVTENFLEEIGLDLDVVINPDDTNWQSIVIDQDSANGASPESTGVPGSLAGALASTVSGGYVLDDLQVSFILEATQAHKDSKNLNAPKVTVLSGESAGIRVETEFSYVADYEFEETTTSGNNPVISSIADPEISVIRDGVVLNVTPTITADKKYVLLRIMTSYTKTDFETYDIPDTETGEVYPIQLPVSQIADVRTRVTVPDGGTLLIGGQKLTGEINKDEGVPVLSKLPVFGRLFENRSKVKDNSVLLILVKPTIILQDEQERDAVAAMESRF